MSSPISSRRKLFFKRKQSLLDNKIPFYIYCVVFGVSDCKTVEGSSRCRNYIAVGRSCDREVTEQYF